MPAYKLIYFKLTGMGEVARLLFAEADVKYEDIRLSKKDEWAGEKSKTPFGKVPLLEVDGKILSQSVAIGRYLANQFGLAGKNDWDQARADMIVHCVDDCWETVRMMSRVSVGMRVELKKEYEQNEVPRFLSQFESILCENNGGDGYFVGDEMTHADLTFTNYYQFIKDVLQFDVSALDDNYPKLCALKSRVESKPRIAKWMKERPANDYTLGE